MVLDESTAATHHNLRAAVAVGLVAVIAATTFAAARLAVYDGDPSGFVRAGVEITDPAGAHDFGHLEPDAGYDGQYFYRLSRSPLSTAERFDGIVLDRPAYRNARIGYPALVWATSGGGSHALVPWALIAVNLAAIGAIGAIGAGIALDIGRSRWFGLLFCAWPGLQVGLAFDLAEPVETAFILAALLALRRRSFLVATIALSCAVMTRESALVVAGALIATRLAHGVARRWPGCPAWIPRSDAVPWFVALVPAAAYGGVQMLMTSRWNETADAGASDSAGAVSVPFLHIGQQFIEWANEFDTVVLVEMIQLALILLLAGVLVAALADRSAGEAWERWALVAGAVSTASFTTWDRAVVYLRYPNLLVVFGLIVYLAARHEQLTESAQPRIMVATLLLLSASSLPIWILI